MINVGVIFGGKACEHDISIITALQLINNIDLEKYNVVPIYITKEGDWCYSKDFNTVENVLKYRSIAKPCLIMPNSNYLHRKTMFGYKPFIKIDVIFVAMHGMNGEDGMVRAVCDMSGIVCVNSHVLPSAIAMNKAVFKDYILGVGGVEQIKSITYNSECNMEDFIADVSKGALKFPLILKPARLGSSIGISVANSVDELREKLIYSSRFDTTILIEEKLTNIKEYNIAVYRAREGLVVSDIEQPIGVDEILSYSDKYLNGAKSSGMASAKRIFPAKVSKLLRTKLVDTSSMLYDRLYLSGVVRFDYIYSVDNKKLYLNELNTIPGSYAHYLFRGRTFSKMIDDMISQAYFEKQANDKIIKYFASSVLKSIGLGIKK